jgi:hypothetical protein
MKSQVRVSFPVPDVTYQTIVDQAAMNCVPVEVMLMKAVQWYAEFLTDQDAETG